MAVEVELARASMAVDVITAQEDGDKGIIEALVSAYNVKYRMGFFQWHTIAPGAFAASILANPVVPLFWMHAWDWTEQPPIGHATASEVEQPKPGLKISGEMYLDQPGVPGVFRSLKAGALKQWSIGYRVMASRVDEDDDENEIVTEAELLEASSVLRGANPETETLEVASVRDVLRVSKMLGLEPEAVLSMMIAKMPDGTKADVETSAPPKVGDEPPAPTGGEGEPDKTAGDEEVTEVDDLVGATRDITEARNRRRLTLTG